ncbi:MAG: ATP-dependent helicase Lhr and Lhr-like helicase [Actinomycetota bacterium]|nr:ATP-dependent helicase Lhr and Lhr-like helicase [Actinomycetota bacterium]
MTTDQPVSPVDGSVDAFGSGLAEIPGASVLDRFGPATRAWFTETFAAPTPAQLGAWAAISRGDHALVVAPTGSGKTLAAFLWAIDRLVSTPSPDEVTHRCRVLYVSPLKALAVDVERNLRLPLAGVRRAADRLGLSAREVRVAVRSGDTPADQRRAFSRTPPDILITTPESLFLLLTSRAREALAGVETVIVDEVHSLAGGKRGAHLTLSLERLDALVGRPTARVGLSATVRPVAAVARWLGGAGDAPVHVVHPPAQKTFDLRVVVPVPDLSDLDAPRPDAPPPGSPQPGDDAVTAPASRSSVWPHVEERVVDLIAEHRSTLVFANSRRLAERLTARLNEVWAERQEGAGSLPDAGSAHPAEVMGQAGASRGAPAVLARAHHGSVSKEQRALIESDLKAGVLPAVVATSSLELGIDMGAIDLVVQAGSPPSVASGLQRVGRAGHQVGAVSHGVLFPTFRSDLVQTAVVVERMRDGRIEALTVPANPLDVLAQQIVAMVAMDPWDVRDLGALVRRAAPFADLGQAVLDAVLDMVSGRYPGDEFAELRPRIVWDRAAGVLTGRPGAQRLAVTSGGTIPDRGLFGVFLAGGEGRRGGSGRRVGELDEEMVYESRVGDVFTLGSSSWRIEEITPDRVLVTPAPGRAGRLPFWHGDAPGRPLELGRAIGAFVREVDGLPDGAAHARVRAAGLDEWAADNLLAYLREQREVTGHVPDDRTLVVERFRDELGDWRVVVHSPFGGTVHAPWALAVAARFRERFGIDVQVMHGDDGLVLRLPDVETADGLAPDVTDLLVLDPAEVEGTVTAELGGSALFASRFRECAGRALLLPRRRPGQRQPLWQQRHRAAQLLAVAGRHSGFPIVLETVRECLQDVFDVPGLTELMRDVASRRVTIVEVDTATPSPFARSLLFGYVAQFLYEGDSPLAERRAAALALDPALLAELLGRGEGAALRDLLDPAALARTEAELQRVAPGRRLPGAEGVADLLRLLGPLTTAEVDERTSAGADDSASGPSLAAAWLGDLEEAGRVLRVGLAGGEYWASAEDAGRLRDALGAVLPPGVAEAFTEPVTEPLGDLLSRFARTHGPFTAAGPAGRFGLGIAVVSDGLRRLVADGRLVTGALRPLEAGGGRDLDFCDAEVLRIVRRRSLAALRAEVEPVSAGDLARFLLLWQGVGGSLRGAEGVLRVVEQLAGAVVPASSLETLILPSRVPGYSPAVLDELTASGDVVWSGHGALPGNDGWVALHPADLAPVTLGDPGPGFEATPAHQALLDVLSGGGAYFFRALSDAVGSTDDAALASCLWELVWAGKLTNDTLLPLRALLAGGRTTHRVRQATSRSRYSTGRQAARRAAWAAAGGRASMPSRTGPPTVAGRWSLLPPGEADVTIRSHAVAEILLDRYGVVTRGSVQAEGVTGGFAAVYRVFSAFEDAGRVRRGYFVDGLGAAQFGSTGAVDRLREVARSAERNARPGPDPERTHVLAASDPANPYGAALPWPEPRGTAHRPGRAAGALVVLVDGDLVLYVERGGRSLLSWTEAPVRLQAAADALALAVRKGALGRLTVERADGTGVLTTGHPLSRALAGAGFHATPKGLRIRG